MKNKLLGLLALVVTGCTSNTSTETKNPEKIEKQEEEHEIQDFYFPLSDTMVPTTYTYEVVTASKDKSPEHYFEFLEFKRNDDGYYTFSRYEKSQNLVDSMVFDLDEHGANVVHHFIKTQENDFVKANVNPKLIFPWKRELNGRMTNNFSYMSVVNGKPTSTMVNVNNGFVGFLEVDNALSNENKCIKIVHQTEARFEDMSTKKVYNYSSKGEIIDLKGIGVYKSIEMNNHGDTTIKKLVDIKRDR